MYVYIYMCDDAMQPTSYALKLSTTQKRPKQCSTFHSCLGLGKSLEQYKAWEALVSWLRAALYCSNDFPTPRHE